MGYHLSKMSVNQSVLLLMIVWSSNCLHDSKCNSSFQIINTRSLKVSQGILLGIFSNKQIEVFKENATLSNGNLKRTCYYAFPRNEGDLMPEKINAFLCTHIMLGFADVFNGTLIPSQPGDVKIYNRLNSLKAKNPNLKILLSTGGSSFSDAVKSEQNRAILIKSAISLLTKYKFDGLDIDWEFPAWNGAPPEDKPNFVLFLRDFKASCRNELLLSVAVAAPKIIIDVSYDVPGLAKYVDFINLMSYDYHDYFWYTPFTGHNSPLFQRSIEKAYFATLNTAWSANYWVSQGMPKSKIMVGIPTYSHTFTLMKKDLHGFDAPSSGYGPDGGEMTYPQICEFLRNGGVSVFDEESQVPYAYKDLAWIGYDDYRSVRAKAEWIKNHSFGGSMTFDLNCDDWSGVCNENGTFPLHKVISDVFTS